MVVYRMVQNWFDVRVTKLMILNISVHKWIAQPADSYARNSIHFARSIL